MSGDKSGSNESKDVTKKQGQNTRIDSRGNTVNFNTGPATIGQKTAPDRVLPSGIVVEDYSRPFQGQINLSNQAMPAPEPEARSYFMSEYLANKKKEPDFSVGNLLEDAQRIGQTITDTPLGATPAQMITNAQQAFDQAKQIQQASPEMRALSDVYNFAVDKQFSAPLGEGTITVTGGRTPGITYSREIGPGFGKNTRLGQGIMSLMNIGKPRQY
jgi:hypothetical protein|tara:strand:- start:3091 stop:3735 length:645 start_codon:yes stop_codon:yes gene_type:complete